MLGVKAGVELEVSPFLAKSEMPRYLLASLSFVVSGLETRTDCPRSLQPDPPKNVHSTVKEQGPLLSTGH